MKKATFKGRVTQFLYLLMRDYMFIADVEDMVRDCEQSDVECTFSNGHLAEYAKELSDRLQDNIVAQETDITNK